MIIDMFSKVRIPERKRHLLVIGQWIYLLCQILYLKILLLKGQNERMALPTGRKITRGHMKVEPKV